MDGGPGRLPRTTFVDDPFFHHDPFDGFSRDGFSRSPQPQRRFGSTPRLIDDEFFNEFDQNMPQGFGSLPRHRHTSRSPQPPTYRGTPPSGQQPSQERSIPVQRASPNNSSQQQPPHQSTPPKWSPVPKGAVEINNAASSYTNGELNPDRKQQQSAPDSPNNGQNNAETRINVEIQRPQQSTPPPKQQKVEKPVEEVEKKPQQQEQPEAKPEEKQPPKQISAAEARRAVFGDKRTSLDAGCTEKLIHLLDEAERRVELLRELASQCEQDKEQLLETLNNVRLNADFLGLAEHDREDINYTAERLLKRCKAVEVSVFTPRNEDQTRALDEVNKLIDMVTNKMKEDLASAKGTIERYHNACCPDEVGPVDQKFQSTIIECTADDQKKIRRKLAQIIEQIDRAERVSNPDY